MVITALHHWRNGDPDTGRYLKVGYLPITCHILCPVTHHRLELIGSKSFLPVKFSSWPEMIEALRGGEIDMAFILAPIAIALKQQGLRIAILLLGHRDGTALVVKKSLNINSLRDLVGGTMAIPIRFSCQNLVLLRLLDQLGIDKHEIKILELAPPDMPSALAAGGIDGYIVGEPYAAQAELAGTGKVLFQMKDVHPNFISSVLIVRKEILKKRQKEVFDLTRAFYRESFWVETHRKQAASIAAQYYGLPASLMQYVLTCPKDRVSYKNLLPDPREFDQIAGLLVKYGLLPRVPKGAELVYTGWLPEKERQGDAE